jgi:hypothetical protein
LNSRLQPADWIGGLAFVTFVAVCPDDAHAQMALANGIKAQLGALAAPALKIGIAWIGYLMIMGKASMQSISVFLIGAAIVFSGGSL